MNLSVNSGQTQGYTFDIIGYEKWPSVSVKYAFKNIGPVPQLQLNYQFNTANYLPKATGKDTDVPAWQKKATDDLLVFKNIHYQLNWQYTTDEAPGTALRVIKHAATTTLTPAAPVNFADEDVIRLSKFIKTIINWLQQLLAGASANTRPSRSPVMKPVLLPVTGVIEEKNIFEIGVTLIISRIDADTNLQVVQTTKAIHSDIKTGVSLKAGQKAFAQNFETAFKSTGSQLKLAAGRGDYNNTTQLWVVRWADSDQDKGIYYSITPGNAVSFAPVPLSRNLIGGDFQIPPYTSGQGIDWNATKTNVRFANIDLDVWMSIFLAGVDEVLDPSTIDAVLTCATLYTLQHADGINPLGEILATKASIAGKLAKLLRPVVTQQTGNLGSATQHITNQLNDKLSNFYQGTAIVQFNATIAANSGTDLVNLYGKIIPAPTSRAASFSEALIPNATASTASFTVTVGNVKLRTYLPVSVTCQPTGLDYKFDEGVIIPLSFIIPPAVQATVLTAKVPLVLRAYPQPTIIVDQANEKTYADDIATIQNVKLYNYTYRFRKPIIAQDAIETSLAINGADVLSSSAYGDTNDLIDSLARFIMVYPQIATDLQASLPVINNTTTVESEAYKTALPALIALSELAANVKSAIVNNDIAAEPANMRHNPQASYSFTLTEGPVDPADNRLLIQVTGDKGQSAALTPPMVSIDGYKAVLLSTVDNDTLIAKSYTYVSDGGKSLLFDGRLNTLSPQIMFPSLDILSDEKINLTVSETRNKNLLPKPEGGFYTTDERFIYNTPQNTEIPAFIPGLHWDGVEFDLQAINPASAKPDLQTSLQLLFGSLFNNTNDVTYNTTINVTYEYKIDGGDFMPSTSLPVLLLPGQLISTTDKSPVATALYNNIKTWLDNVTPGGLEPRLYFKMDIFTSLKELGAPILTIDRLYFNLSDVN